MEQGIEKCNSYLLIIPILKLSKTPTFDGVRIKEILLIFCGVFIFLLISCNDKEDDGLIGQDLEIVEIIDPPDIPDIYTESLIQPKVRIRNNGVVSVDSLGVNYFVMMVDSIEIKEYGPVTWITTINPGEEMIVNLTKWDTITGNTPLIDGTYYLYVILGKYIPSGHTEKDKTFIVEL